MFVRCIQYFVAMVIVPFFALSLRAAEAELVFKQATWFPDEISTAYIFLEVDTEPVVELPNGEEEVRIYDSQVIDLGDDERGRYAVVMDFVPRRPGVRTFPSVKVSVGDTLWQTRPKQFVVSEVLDSERMSLKVEPEKRTVFQGEPLRIDFMWESDLPVDQMRAFRLSPSFFNDPAVKVFIPRSTVAPDDQFGLPVGGRRVITHRIQDRDAAPGRLGTVFFSIWVRFEEAGQYEIPKTALECAQLEKKGYGAHQYASYFNNSLFEPVDRSKAYQKLRTHAEGFRLEVLPLNMSGKTELFSGLFSPDSIEVSVSPRNLELGQLMEIRIDVKTDVCSEMLELPSMALQSSLRHRFWVADEMGETWRADGRSFVARARPLSVDSRYFPSLSFQVFDADAGRYRTIETQSIPLEIESTDGRRYFPVDNLPGAKRLVEANAEGVWHNDKGSFMSEIGHVLISVLSRGVFVFLLLGPLLFIVLMPWAREFRRRSEDEKYRRRRTAYGQFRSGILGGGHKVEALRSFVAQCFERPEKSLTAKDAAELLKNCGCNESDAAEVESLLRELDEPRYSISESIQTPDTVDREIVSTLGKAIYRNANRVGFFICTLLFVGLASDVKGASWQEAERRFDDALELSESGEISSVIEERFAEAALAFESCADAGVRVGAAWYNAGNAWFKAGELGRAIASYRRAEAFRPFDKRLHESLAAARALRVDVIGTGKVEHRVWPQRWGLALFSLLWIGGWSVLMFWIRYRRGAILGASLVLIGTSLLVGGIELRDHLAGRSEGVLIASEAYGRKGPGFAYQSAFKESLHSGVEFEVLESRADWLRVSLGPDGECWLPAKTVELL